MNEVLTTVNTNVAELYIETDRPLRSIHKATKRVAIAGLNIDVATRPELLHRVQERVVSRETTFIVTPYSEVLWAALRDPRVLEIYNSADIAVPDGIALFWAVVFLKTPLTALLPAARTAQAVYQAIYTLLAIVLKPKLILSAFPEKIPGSDLVWDLAELAANERWSVYLLGGFEDTAVRAAAQLTKRFPNLRIAGCSNKDPDDPTILEDIDKAKPDFLYVAYGPIRQELWIVQHLPVLPVRLAIGLGGTFDYLAGNVRIPPKCVRQCGFEWLFRLITQPRRYRRIVHATVGLISELVKFKKGRTATQVMCEQGASGGGSSDHEEQVQHVGMS